MIYEAITELREDLRLIDSVIEQIEGLVEDPPRRLRTRKAPLNQPLHRHLNGTGRHARRGDE